MSTPSSLASLKILVVEDEPEVRFITGSMVRELGHTVVEVGNAEDALALLHTTPIDVLVADIGLPGMSGDVFAAHARGVQAALGIVFATGGATVQGVPNDATNTVLLRKPYDIAALEHALATVVSVR